MIPVAAEYEFYHFKGDDWGGPAKSLKAKDVGALQPLTEGMFGYSLTRPVHNQKYYYDVYNMCRKFRCNIESWHTETGPGVFEAVSRELLLSEAGFDANGPTPVRRLSSVLFSKWPTVHVYSS